MTIAPYLTCLPFTLDVEAGYQDARTDPGNWTSSAPGVGTLIGTNRGITAPLLADWLGRTPTVADMQALTVADATAIYAAKFWNPILGDQLPPGVNLSTFDMQVNAGTNGARCLQRAAGVAADGWIGPATLAAITAVQPSHVALRWSRAAARTVQEALGLEADGVVGPKTLAALGGPEGGAIALCGAAYDQHVTYYTALHNAADQSGWLNRAAERLTAAVRLAAA